MPRRQPPVAAPYGPLLELEQVTKTYDMRGGPLRRRVGTVRAVDGVSLAVQPGEILGLVGESGCGKSTLARIIVQLEAPTSGRVRFDGRQLDAYRVALTDRRRLQLVFQDPTSSLDPRQRVGDAIAEPLLAHRLSRSAADRSAAVFRLLDEVGLPAAYSRRLPRELSGGERQRVAIARAISLRPSLLVLDEPVASLDVYVGAQVLELLRELHARERMSYIVISHDLRVIGSLCQRVAVMYLGRIVEVADARELFRAPRHPYTELLLESAGLRAAGVTDRGDIPSPLSPPSGCAFRTRCPLAEPLCAEREPALESKEPGRLVSCHKRP